MGGSKRNQVTKAIAYAPPSAVARATLSCLLLLGFYVIILGVAALLASLPILTVVFTRGFGLRTLVLFVFCWIPAGLLVVSVFTTRRPAFIAPRRRLQPDEAPALFAIIGELAERAGTAPPTEVYLEVLPNLAVTEVGGVFRSRRVMIVGAPILYLLSVDELRAAIAHELGHFVGGDTRLTTFSAQTHSLFASVISSVERDAFRVGAYHYSIEAGLSFAQAIGHGLVGGYSRLYLLLTRPLNRRQERAADALSAALVSARAASSALEKAVISGSLYRGYLQDEVGFAMKRGAMPTDLVSGFERLREQRLAGEAGRAFVESLRAHPTHVYDSHPALGDRLRALAEQPQLNHEEDARPATTLVADPVAFDTWLVAATREHLIAALIASGPRVTALRELPWARIPEEVYAPAAKEGARRAAARLYPLLPTARTLGSMFAAVWRQLDTGNAIELIVRLEPAIQNLPPRDALAKAASLCRELLGTLFQGALLERGALVEDSFGEPTLVLRLGEERVSAADALILLATDTEAGRAAFNRWAERLEGV